MPRELQQSFVGGEMSPDMFGRISDVHFQHGAAKLQNLIPTPQGPARKRPGTRFVREIKDSSNRARLLPFRYDQEQTLVIEMGRATVSAREIGYFRFHTQGSTVLYQLPDTYADPVTVTALNTGNGQFTGGTHFFQTGDPVALTMHPTSLPSVAFASSTVTLVNTFRHGQQVMFEVQSGSLPSGLENRRLYYVSNPTATTFKLAATRFGNELEFGTHSGTIYCAAMPDANSHSSSVRKTYYCIRDDSTHFKLALTKELALAGTSISWGDDGTISNNDVRMHYDYQPADMVVSSGKSYYCFRRTVGGADTLYLTFDDHSGHTTADTNYWVQLPGDAATVTFTLGSDIVNWTGHGQAEGTTVIFSSTGTLPTGITEGTTYYVRNPNANDFQVAESPGGAVIDLGGSPSGTHTALAGSIYEAPHFFDFDELLEVRYAQSNDVLTLTHQNRPATELRRRGATDWVVGEVDFNGAIGAPDDVSVAVTEGYGIEVSSMTVGTPTVITTTNPHGLTLHETIMVRDLDPSVPDGNYVVGTLGTGSPPTTFQLWTVDGKDNVTSSAAVLGTKPRVRPTTLEVDWAESYVVTALDENGEESEGSAEYQASNNLAVQGAYNTVSWSAVPGAARYRVYKKQEGVFGFIAEVEELAFVDDNLGPDLSITPPILDTSLRKTSVVTFNGTDHLVEWTSHGLVDGDPVIFQSSGTLPTALTDYATYYVLNPEDDSFQVAATSGGTVLDLSGADTDERHEATGGAFPTAVSYFEQRRVFAGSMTSRQRLWLTASGTESDLSYSLPTVDSDRIQVGIASRDAGALRHVVPLNQLMVLSGTTEFRVTPVNDDALTPSSIAIRPQSYVGANKAQPALCNNVAVFAADRGGHARELGYSDAVLGYLTGDLSLRAHHLFGGYELEEIAYAKAPDPVVWFVSTSGKLLGLTYLPEEQVGAWHQHVTDGEFESVVAVAEGDEDHTYVIVKRNVDGGDVRYVERMAVSRISAIEDSFFVDAGVTYDGSSTSTIGALDHLEGESVVALADGLVQGPFTVSSGSITLTTAASTVQVGLPYTAELETLPITVQIEAGGRGRTRNVNRVTVRVSDSGAFDIGPTQSDQVPSQVPAAGSLLTAAESITVDPSWNLDGQIFLTQDDPLPLSIVSLAYEVEVGG